MRSTTCVVLRNKVAPTSLKDSILSEIGNCFTKYLEGQRITRNSKLLSLNNNELLVVEGKTLVFTVCEVDQLNDDELVNAIREGDDEREEDQELEDNEDFAVVKQQQDQEQNKAVCKCLLFSGAR